MEAGEGSRYGPGAGRGLQGRTAGSRLLVLPVIGVALQS